MSATIKHLLWVPRRGRRPRNSSTFIPLLAETINFPIAGTAFDAGWAHTELHIPGTKTKAPKAKFAFWAISGHESGRNTGDFGEINCPNVTVGTSNITATAWYVPSGGAGPGSEFWIDAFDTNLNTFVDHDFVNISPNTELTTTANLEGFIPINPIQQTISAFHNIGTSNFVEWKNIGHTAPIMATALTLRPNNSTGISFAFYERPAGTSGIGNFKMPKSILDIIGQANIDGKGYIIGPGGVKPIDPWGPLIMDLYAQTLAIAISEKLKEKEKGTHFENIYSQFKELITKMNYKM